MPRTPRLTAPGTLYHLIARFIGGEWFIRTDGERAQYLALLGRALGASDWMCLAYAIMSNHIHLAMIAGAEPLGEWARRVHSPFAEMMNRTRGRIGAMFVRGPKDHPLAPARCAPLIAYLHNNPVRAGVVAHPRESAWTSHRAYAGLAPAPSWLRVDEGMARAGFVDRGRFDEWVARCPPDAEIARRVAASLDQLERRQPRVDRQCRHRAVAPSALAIVRVTAEELGVPAAALLTRRRGEAQVAGRRIAAECAERFGLSGVEIARALQISQQGVSASVARPCSAEVARVRDRVLERFGVRESEIANDSKGQAPQVVK